MSFAEMNMSLENFVKRFQLPHSAKVIEGYQGEYDMEFSTGEVLMVYRAAYPLSVSLTLNDPPPAGKAKQVSISAVNDDVRFHVVSRYDEPRIFRSVKEVIDSWPLTIKSLTDDVTGDGGGTRSGSGSGQRYRRHDQLRLLGSRLHQTENTVLLECRLARTRQTVLLSEHDRGEFLEVADQQSFTVQELVDLPRATRTLRLDASARGSSYPSGIPANYGGTLTMNKPDVKVQIARVLEGDLDDNVTLSDPVLVPVDCSITVAPRDDVYRQDILFPMHSLRGIVENAASQFPFVVRVAQVIQTSAVLLIHTVHTNDLVVIFSRKPVHKILSHCGDRYFLVPVTHQGYFVANGGSNDRLDLAKLGAVSFPMQVRYVIKDYANMIEDLPSDDVIAFDALIDDDVSAVAAKVFDENVGSAFHVSLSANVKVQKTNWRGKLHQVPAKMSPYADCSEEISEERYNEIMELSSPKPKPK